MPDNQSMKTGTGKWYTEKGTKERPTDDPNYVALYRAGKFIAIVKAAK